VRPLCCCLSPLQVLADGGLAEPAALGDLPLADATGVLESEDLLDLTHSNWLSRHAFRQKVSMSLSGCLRRCTLDARLDIASCP